MMASRIGKGALPFEGAERVRLLRNALLHAGEFSRVSRAVQSTHHVEEAIMGNAGVALGNVEVFLYVLPGSNSAVGINGSGFLIGSTADLSQHVEKTIVDE
jgi:hypothetical protein